MKKYLDKYRISSTRLQNWNYGWNAAYFITICTANRENYFGKILNGQMILSNVGLIANIMWFEIKNHARHIVLDAFVVMPNHVHGIIILNGFNSKTMGGLGGDTIDDDATDGDAMSDDGMANDGMADDGIVETRHALSLSSKPLQSPQKTKPLSQSHSPTIGQQRYQNQGKNTLSSIIGAYKSAVTKHVHRLGFEFEWQSRFYDHIIRDKESFRKIQAYIMNNPAKWEKDKFHF